MGKSREERDKGKGREKLKQCQNLQEQQHHKIKDLWNGYSLDEEGERICGGLCKLHFVVRVGEELEREREREEGHWMPVYVKVWDKMRGMNVRDFGKDFIRMSL